MSADAEVQEGMSQASPEVQAAAEKQGWIPPSRYKGDPANFIDADAYIERGKTITPIVQAQNKKLKEQLDAQAETLRNVELALKHSQEAILDLEEAKTAETLRAAKLAKDELKAQIKEARANGDVDAEMELLDELRNHDTPAAKPEAKPDAPAAPKVDPDLVRWMGDNKWFEEDDVRAAVVTAMAKKLRQEGDKSTGYAFYDACAKRADEEIASRAGTRPQSKVEGGKGGSGSGSSDGKSYSDLPREAKEACDADIKRFVGNDKRYKTAAEWRAKFCQTYFRESTR